MRLPLTRGIKPVYDCEPRAKKGGLRPHGQTYFKKDY